MSYLAQRDMQAKVEVAKRMLPKGYCVLPTGEMVRKTDLAFLDACWRLTQVYGTPAGLDGTIYARLTCDAGGLVG